MGYWLPDGCTQEDCDRAAGGYDPPECSRCSQTPCECCKQCGATPDQACEEWCGMEITEEDRYANGEYWNTVFNEEGEL